MGNSAQLANLGGAYGAGSTFGFKNRIINGAMMIDQRNAGASVTPSGGQYLLDRWVASLSQSAKYSVQQNAGSVTPPAGFTKYLGVTSLSSYSVTAADFFSIQQLIEGFNVADLGWGTSSASPITVSFWVRSSLTGSFGAAIQNEDLGRAYPFTYTINAANTWEYKTVTIAGDTTGNWWTDNRAGVRIRFNLGTGTDRTGPAGSWASANYNAPNSTVSVVGTNGATFYITGVQLEKGSTATSFDYRPYGTELALCQRYCLADYSSGNFSAFGTGMVYSSTGASFTRQFPVPMRTGPSSATVSNVAGFIVDCGGVAVQTTNVTLSVTSPTTARVSAIVASGLTTGQGCTLVNDGSGTARSIIYSAEL